LTVVQDEFRTLATPPPTVSVARAMLWNWWVVVLSVVVFVGAGAAYALLRTPTYTATARLAVGRIDITSPGALSGYALATEALATGYSRTATALAVARPVSAKTGIPVKEVQSHVTATPIPESPVFKVEGTAPNADQAIALANATGHALIRYAARLNQDNPDSERLFHLYEVAVRDRKLAGHEERAAASLRAEALSKAYTQSLQSQVSTQLIQVISPATEASSDRRSMFMILAFIGLVAGLLVGGAIAFLRESRLSVDLAK
jgi:capsular polysaccharide biosynthesis protein